VVQVFDVPLVAFLERTRHIHTDIDYFGTPAFRVHTFDLTTNVLLTSSAAPAAPLDVVTSLQTGSFRDAASTGPARAAITPTPLLTGGARLSDCSDSATRFGRQVVFGLTAAILIEVAVAVFGRPQEFELHPEGGMCKAEPAFVTERQAKL
jgi:hypothetical protein